MTKFNHLWLAETKYSSWLIADESNNRNAKCKLCMSVIQLSNMGKRALEAHCKTKKHLEGESARESSSVAMASWLLRPSSSSNSGVTSSASAGKETESVTETSILKQVELNATVTKAEILWTLSTVKSHQSYNSTKHDSALFSAMFPDSEIAQKFSFSPHKCSYLACFGLSSYFEDLLLAQLKEVPVYSVSFDESYNSVTKNEQMDLNIRFWDAEHQRIVNRYIGSQFLGHATANDLLDHFREGTSKLDGSKIIQISMDGPNVNLKFLRDFIAAREALEPNLPFLIDIGSCGLHVVHGAFKTGFEATGWKLDVLLKSLHYLFNESPARRADYKIITSSTLFPLPFSGTRWLEDKRVAERAVNCWGNMIKYTEKVSSGPKNKIPKCASYNHVLDAVKDKFTLAKLHVFINVANLMKPFLEIFQSDKPLVPFLGQELFTIIKALMEKFIQKHLISGSTTALASVLKVDVKNTKNHVPLSKVSIGFAAKEALSQSHAEDNVESLDAFRKQCVECYKAVVIKMQDRSPLKYDIVRQLICLNPNYISSHPNSSITKFEALMSTLIARKLLQPEECDKLLKQYKDFGREKVIKELFSDYNVTTGERLDVLFANLIGREAKFKHL